MIKNSFIFLFIFLVNLFADCDSSLQNPHTQVCGAGWGVELGAGFSAKCCKEEKSDFDVWDANRNISDRNISTAVVLKDFNLTMASLNEDNNDTQEFNGTVCFKVFGENNETEYDKVFFDETNETNVTLNVDFISKDSYVYLKWLKDTNTTDTNCSQTLDGEANSTDDFAIRPDKFYFELNETEFYAGEKFLIKSYVYDKNNNEQKDYNETTDDNSFELNISETRVDCVTSDEDLEVDDINFTDGSSNETNISYTGLAELNITLKEVGGSEFAKVDEDDTEVEKRFISSYTKLIFVQPYEVNITSSNIDSSTGKSWVYMAQPEDMNISFKTTVVVNNKQHEIQKDFNSTCYAKDINLTFGASTDGEDSYPMVYISVDSIFSDGSTKKEQNLSDINQTITVLKDSFTDGEATAQMDFNYDRNYSNKVSPFKISGLEVQIDTTDVAKFENSDTTLDDGVEILYFGRLNPQVVKTDKDINYSVTIEVYDKNLKYTNGFKAQLFNWYEMSLHSSDEDGNITDVIPKKNNLLSSGEEFSIDNISSPNGGKIDVEIQNSTEGVYVLHVKTQPWLWYFLDSYGNEYNDTQNSTCIQHPCVKYIFAPNTQTKISSGNFDGGDIEIDTKAKLKRTGVKIYR